MKNIYKIFPAIVIVFSLFYLTMSSEEVGPYINLNPKAVDSSLLDTTYISQSIEAPAAKKVLIEDFTGVHCPNCPKAAIELANLQSKYPDKIVAMSLHPKGLNFTEPFDGHWDFRTDEGTRIYEMLGKSIGLPAGGIDRVHYQGENYTLINFLNWSKNVDTRLQMSSPVNIHLFSRYNHDSSDYAHVWVNLQYTEDVADSHFVSVALIENDIEDWQIGNFNVIDSHYVHKHILRGMLTPYDGEFLMYKPEKGRTYIKEFKIKIAKDWVAGNCHFVVFVHKRSYIYDVVQAEEKHL